MKTMSHDLLVQMAYWLSRSVAKYAGAPESNLIAYPGETYARSTEKKLPLMRTLNMARVNMRSFGPLSHSKTQSLLIQKEKTKEINV